jgi:histone chaperone ASF1
MSIVNVTNVVCLDNPTKFSAPFRFEITFGTRSRVCLFLVHRSLLRFRYAECSPPGLKEELEWKLVYVGSAEDEKCDQELDGERISPLRADLIEHRRCLQPFLWALSPLARTSSPLRSERALLSS